MHSKCFPIASVSILQQPSVWSDRPTRSFLKKSTKQQGFTLFEILIVVILIALSALIIIPQLGLGNAQKHVRDEAARLAIILGAVRQEAILKFKTYVMQVHSDRYRFLVVGDLSGPQPLEDALFRVRRLPDYIYLKTDLTDNEFISLDRFNKAAEDEAYDDSEQAASADLKEKSKPILNVIVSASGDLSPFSLRFVGESGEEFLVTGELTGQINVNDPNDS